MPAWIMRIGIILVLQSANNSLSCMFFINVMVFISRNIYRFSEWLLKTLSVTVENLDHPVILKHVIKKDGVIHGEDFNALDDDIKLLYKKKARDQFLATSFLLGRNRTKYSQLVMTWCWDILRWSAHPHQIAKKLRTYTPPAYPFTNPPPPKIVMYKLINQMTK